MTCGAGVSEVSATEKHPIRRLRRKVPSPRTLEVLLPLRSVLAAWAQVEGEIAVTDIP
jgi:hypothetical protein